MPNIEWFICLFWSVRGFSFFLERELLLMIEKKGSRNRVNLCLSSSCHILYCQWILFLMLVVYLYICLNSGLVSVVHSFLLHEIGHYIFVMQNLPYNLFFFQWRRGLKLSGESAVEKITLEGVRALRVMLSATVHDVLYYMSPIYCQDIIDSVIYISS